jgi:carboxypeptidase family protein
VARLAALVVAVHLLWAARAGAADPVAPPRRTVSATVVDQAGKPLAGVMVFAADASKVIGMAQSDATGAVELPAPRPRYNFGLLSPALHLAGVTPRGRGRYDLVAAPLPPVAAGEGVDRDVARISAGGASVFRGRVVDEAGGGLAGVRVEAVRASGAIVSTVFSTAGGQFALVVPGGEFGLRASAPGLKAVKSADQQGRLVVVMGIDAEVQTLSITTGRTLSFRPSDSIDPEYTPPAPVRAWLRFAYGICPTATPLKWYEKQNLKKYWYLDVLRKEPPNPATISTVTCTPPSAADQLARGQGTTNGFEIWDDGVVAPLLQ